MHTPVVGFLTKTISSDEPIFASGKTLPNTLIEARLVDQKGQESFFEKKSDELGNWEITINKPLPRDTYTFSVTARDARGATSYPTAPLKFKIIEKPVISFGFIDLGWFEILIILALLIASAASISAWYYVSQKSTREAYRIIIGRDIEKLSTLLSDYLKELKNLQELHDTSRSTQATTIIGKMLDTITKMKKYIGEEVSKLK